MVGIVLMLLAVGLAAGTIGSLVGLGGGVIIVPALIFLSRWFGELDVSPHVATGTSLAVIAVSSLSSSISYFKQRKVDTGSALLFFAGSGPGAIAGAFLNDRLEGGGLLVGFGCFMLAVSFLIMVRDKLGKRQMRWTVHRSYRDPASGETYAYGYTKPSAFLVSFATGLLAGLFGVGGGALMVPVMLILFHFPVQVAAATSMFLIFLSSIPGGMMHAWYGHIDWLYAALLAPGAWAGGKIGAWLSLRLRTKTLVLVLRLMLIATGLRLIWAGVQAM
jgi:hypothetical protein